MIHRYIFFKQYHQYFLRQGKQIKYFIAHKKEQFFPLPLMIYSFL